MPRSKLTQPTNEPTTADPFVIDSFVSTLASCQALPAPPDIEMAADDHIPEFLRPYVHKFRVDPFSTHDGIRGRPVPSKVPVCYLFDETRPATVQFQLDLSGNAADSDAASGASVPAEPCEPVKCEDSAISISSPRLLYPPETRTYFPSSADTIAANTDASPPRVLYPESDHGAGLDHLDTTWTPPALYSAQPSPCRATVCPPRRIFEPFAHRAYVSDHSQYSPVPTYPTSMAYSTEYAPSGNESGSYADSSGSSIHVSTEHGYESWAVAHSSQVDAHAPPHPSSNDYSSPMSVDQTHDTPAYHSYHPQSRSEHQPQSFPYQSTEQSFTQPSVPPQQGVPVPSCESRLVPQPPMNTSHDPSTTVSYNRFSCDRDSQAVSPLPPYLCSSRFAQVSPSPPVIDPTCPVKSSRSISPTPSASSESSSFGAMSSRSPLGSARRIPGSRRGLYSKGKKHTCRVCKKDFVRPSSLKTHMNTHTGERPYYCPVISCGRRFSVSSNLNRHVRIHGLNTGLPRGPRKKANNPSGERESIPDRRHPSAETWVPESLRGMRNAKLLSHRPPFRILENTVNLTIPLPPVRPHGHPGEENFEERDSFYRTDSAQGLLPYHPDSWKVRSILPGPLPSQRDREQHAANRARASVYAFGSESAQVGGWFRMGDRRV
ncbi:C2H2 zinc finger [Ceratobasidium sp. AG-Ba]|nr:C2H2 zinc finger [Ceratobasidium sp. AG-Ba]